MPDSLTLSPVDRKTAADRLWRIVTMIDQGASLSSIREAVTFTAFAMENPSWDGHETTPLNREHAA